MLHLMLRDELPHPVDMHVEVRAVLVQTHDDVLGPPIGKRWNQRGPSASNHLVDASEETFELFLLVGM